ncbi:uroporphyrinogen-III synthase [Lysinibacter sp. HNR]|uniref:uroporphyrinogen-III synthase n=1 Tax=Lysinibacter sp. HNR TaxID=3031408 RepID=UPI0024356028|nr:uroporphyrinogen-III synthase [Lysinibacter sp. HNR]WGD37823.1 uroporphyrinogen-III synthase [Lysinibacter sp. HNR]
MMSRDRDKRRDGTPRDTARDIPQANTHGNAHETPYTDIHGNTRTTPPTDAHAFPPANAPRILIPRGGEWGERAARQVHERGFIPVMVPLITTAPSGTPKELHTALERLSASEFDWLVVASANAVPPVANYAAALPPETRVAAVGEATAHTLTQVGFRVDLVPSGTSSATDLVAQWPRDRRGSSALVLGSQLSPPTLADGIHKLGLSVQRVEAYQTVPVRLSPEERQRVTDGGVDVILITSASVATQVAEQLAPLPHTTQLVCIGESSARACTALGLAVATVARVQSVPGMLEVL